MTTDDLPLIGRDACDTHCHVFGPADRFPYSPARKYEPVDTPKETLQALHASLGFNRAVIVQATAHGLDNRAMLEAVASRPDQYRGVAMVDDSFDDAALLAMHEAGVRGVRFNFVQSLSAYPDPAVFDAVVARIKPLGWHVDLHGKGGDLMAICDVLKALPVPFVVDPMGRVDVAAGAGQPAFQLLLELMRRDGGWVKLSCVERMAPRPYVAATPFAAALVGGFPIRCCGAPTIHTRIWPTRSTRPSSSLSSRLTLRT